MFCNVRALFLDEGREQEVKSHQLLQLPAQFHTLPPQALEIIVCRAMPIDAEVKWNPKVSYTGCTHWALSHSLFGSSSLAIEHLND